MECYLAAVILSVKLKTGRKCILTQNRAMVILSFCILYRYLNVTRAVLSSSPLSVSSSPSPSLPLSLSVLTGTSRLWLFADLSWGADSSHTTWCHSSVKLRRNRHYVPKLGCCNLCFWRGAPTSPASVQTACSSYNVSVSSSFCNSCKVRLFGYLSDWHIMIHGCLLGEWSAAVLRNI